MIRPIYWLSFIEMCKALPLGDSHIVPAFLGQLLLERRRNTDQKCRLSDLTTWV